MRRPVRRILLLIILPAVGCQDALPTGRPISDVPLVSELDRSGLAASLEDARLRLLPALSEPTLSARVARDLQDLSAALTMDDRAALDRAADRLKVSIGVPSSPAEAEYAADLDALRLVAGRISELLEAPQSPE